METLRPSSRGAGPSNRTVGSDVGVPRCVTPRPGGRHGCFTAPPSSGNTSRPEPPVKELGLMNTKHMPPHRRPPGRLSVPGCFLQYGREPGDEGVNATWAWILSSTVLGAISFWVWGEGTVRNSGFCVRPQKSRSVCPSGQQLMMKKDRRGNQKDPSTSMIPAF